jgi:Ca2+-binding EF-hand superfamily protein
MYHIFNKVTELEKYLLAMVYDDLAKRCKDNIVSRDTFQVFFHNSGLMAELMFSKFDEKKNGTISKEEFLRAFEINVKGTFEEKADALFEFYSMERSGGIRYGELLRIVNFVPYSS